MVRSASSAILPHHFDKNQLNFALSAAMMGLSIGLIIYPMAASYLFMHYGFNQTMMMLSPLMLLHFLGVGCYTQGHEDKMSEVKLEDRPVSQSLKIVLTDAKVC